MGRPFIAEPPVGSRGSNNMVAVFSERLIVITSSDHFRDLSIRVDVEGDSLIAFPELGWGLPAVDATRWLGRGQSPVGPVSACVAVYRIMPFVACVTRRRGHGGCCPKRCSTPCRHREGGGRECYPEKTRQAKITKPSVWRVAEMSRASVDGRCRTLLRPCRNRKSRAWTRYRGIAGLNGKNGSDQRGPAV